MRRTHYVHVAAVFVAAVLARAVLFNYVGVWGDAGFYTYDAMLILDGQTPFVDFIGRSPLFNYAYAATASVFGNSIAVLRSFIALWWLLAGLPVYYIGRKIHGHRAGIASMIVFELSPFMLVYAFWANTQSLAALLAITALACIVWRGDWLGYAGAGLLLGVAFLSRRSVVTIFAGVGLYILYRSYRQRDARGFVTNSAAAIVAFLVPLSIGYLALGGGDVGMALKFAETHAWGLVSSHGRGGFPLIAENAPAEPLNRIDQGRVPIFNDICQMCGAWTARTFLKTIIATVVIIGPLVYYFRDWVDRWFSDALRDYTLGIVALMSVYAAYVAVGAGLYLRVGALASLLAFGVVAFRGPAIDRETLYGKHMTLLLLAAFMLMAGYLYRNRIIHAYYFADFLPMLSVLAGVIYVEAWDVIGDE